MNTRHFTIPATADDIKLATAVMEPDDVSVSKGIFQFVHGMTEHKEYYFPLMEWLVDKGFICVIHDHRGHGASARGLDDFGYMDKGGWRAMVEDVKAVGDWAKEEYRNISDAPLPFIMFGHSMGSMVVRSYIKRYDDTIDALFVCGSPSDNPAKGLGKILAWLFGVLKGWHYRPELIQKIGFGRNNDNCQEDAKKYKKAWVCSDKDFLEIYHNDPICGFTFTSNGFYNLSALMIDCYDAYGWKLAKPDLPIKFIAGEYDPCIRSEQEFHEAVQLLREIGYTDVSDKIYPGMRHEVHNETDRIIVWNDILEYVENKVKLRYL